MISLTREAIRFRVRHPSLTSSMNRDMNVHVSKLSRGTRMPNNQRSTVYEPIDAREEWALSTGAAYLAPGRVLLAELSSKGGSTNEQYKEKKVARTRYEVTYRKDVDDPELERDVKQTISRARWILRDHATRFVAGTYFVGEKEYPEVIVGLERIKRAAEALNVAAAEIGSNRVTRVAAFPLAINVDDKDLAKRIGESIYERLVSLREAYTSDTKNLFQAYWYDCQNLGALVEGKQRQVIKEALDYTETIKGTLLRRYRTALKDRNETKTEALRLEIDYRPVESAIALFERRR